MTEYVKSTNFTSKDTLATGNPLKIVKGSEFDTEFNNIATAVATKADLAGPTFTGVPAAPTASAGTSTTQIATTAFVATAVSTAVTAYDTALTVSTSQIEDDAVTAAKIAAGAVGNSELATDAVTQAKMADSSVGTAELIDANVTTVKIANANITASKLSGAQTGTAPVYGARAWVTFDGTGTVSTNQTILASGNVTSVYKNAGGDYTVTFTTALPNGNYAIVGFANSFSDSGADQSGLVTATNTFAPSSSSCRISVANSYNGDLMDVPRVSLVFFG